MARFVVLRTAAVVSVAAAVVAVVGAIFMFMAIGLGSTMADPPRSFARECATFVGLPLLASPVLAVVGVLAWRSGNRAREALDPWAGAPG